MKITFLGDFQQTQLYLKKLEQWILKKSIYIFFEKSNLFAIFTALKLTTKNQLKTTT